jgi:CheY-like chemotaxis protein
MTDLTQAGGKARGQVLVVEDEWLIAEEVSEMLGVLGFEVVGPVPTAAQALALIAGRALDAAILDISLDGDYSFPVADELMRRDIAFLFLSGYAKNDIPLQFRGQPLLRKPVALEVLAAQMKRLFG